MAYPGLIRVKMLIFLKHYAINVMLNYLEKQEADGHRCGDRAEGDGGHPPTPQGDRQQVRTKDFYEYILFLVLNWLYGLTLL